MLDDGESFVLTGSSHCDWGKIAAVFYLAVKSISCCTLIAGSSCCGMILGICCQSYMDAAGFRLYWSWYHEMGLL